MKILRRIERLEIKYDNNTEQKNHEETMVTAGWIIRCRNQESETISPATLFERESVLSNSAGTE
jgi:hypothetical protein